MGPAWLGRSPMGWREEDRGLMGRCLLVSEGVDLRDATRSGYFRKQSQFGSV
jgi:hypothetical protein